MGKEALLTGGRAALSRGLGVASIAYVGIKVFDPYLTAQVAFVDKFGQKPAPTASGNYVAVAGKLFASDSSFGDGIHV